MSFKALKVWRSLKRNPGVGLRGVVADIGWTEYAVAHSLLRLMRAGCAVREGCGPAARWWATKVAPTDGRGKAERSQPNLWASQRKWKERLVMANAAKKVTVRKFVPPAPVPAIELERCWGFLPVSGRIARRDEPCSIALRAGLARPEET